MEVSARQQYNLRWAALKQERSSWLDHYRELSTYLLPRTGRFLLTDRNRGEKKHNSIYDSTGTRALRVLAAGLMAGMTSPARPWFRLATVDRSLMELEPVKAWLFAVTELMRDIFARSNTYNTLHMLYEELGVYGTAATIVLPDYDTVIHHNSLTAGEYAIAVDHKGQVNTLYREYEATVSNLVGKFGIENVSPSVKNLYDNRRGLDNWVPVLHAIQPREDRDTRKYDAKNMRFSSCYMEMGREDDKLLRESGFQEFPALCPRWHVSGGDILGNGPGMEALGDVKQLQHEQFRKAQGIDYQTLPPLQMPTAMKNSESNTLPGGVSYLDVTAQNAGIRTAFDVTLRLDFLLEDIKDVRGRVKQAFFEDLFMMIANDQRASPATAREIAERHEEKLLMLGPTLERLHTELLMKKIDMTFARALTARIIPPPPREMQNSELKVKFISTLAQAQQLVGLGAIERLLGTIAIVSPVRPDILDKLDTDQLVDVMADTLGVDPSLIVADDKVALIRAERTKKEQAMQIAAAVPPMAGAAKDLASADTSGKNALTDVMRQLTGYSTQGAPA